MSLDLTAKEQQVLDQAVAAYEHALAAEGITGAALADHVTRYRQMCIEMRELFWSGYPWGQKPA